MNTLSKQLMVGYERYPIKRLVLSHSSVTLFDNCQRKFELMKFFGAQRLDEDRYAADCGNAIHCGFGKWLETYDEKKALFTFAMNFPFTTEFLRPGQAQRSFEACYATTRALMNSHLLQPYEIAKIKDQHGVIRNAIEVPFAIEILNAPLDIPVWYVGFVDDILFNNVRNSFLVVDLKSTRYNYVDMGPRYQFDEQTVPYGIILEHVLGHAIKDMEVAYLSAYIDLLEPKIQLVPVTKTEEHIQDWLRQLCERIERIGKYAKSGWWPRTSDGNGCISFNRACTFSEQICGIRDHELLNRVIQGECHEELFRPEKLADGTERKVEPWITAKLEWQRPF